VNTYASRFFLTESCVRQTRLTAHIVILATVAGTVNYMWHKASCPSCAVFNEEILELMKEHLKAEHELCEWAFVARDSVATHEANLRILQILEKISQLRARFEMHILKEHSADTAETGNAWNF
jgi:hypothetical protein